MGAGVIGDADAIEGMPGARCSADLCAAVLPRGGRRWRVLATRSPYSIDFDALAAACRWADIVVSERRLPRRCAPRWLKLDAAALAQTGGVAIVLAPVEVRTVIGTDRHPWVVRPETAARSPLTASTRGWTATR